MEKAEEAWAFCTNWKRQWIFASALESSTVWEGTLLEIGSHLSELL